MCQGSFVREQRPSTSRRSFSSAIPNRTENLGIVFTSGREEYRWEALSVNGAIIVPSPKNDYRSRSSPICEGSNCGSFLPIDNVLGGIQIGVDPSVPQRNVAIAYGRQFKFKRLPVSIEYEVDEDILACEVSTERDAV
jgi:hypothetical protein